MLAYSKEVDLVLAAYSILALDMYVLVVATHIIGTAC